jgi:hypothetical protein
VCKIDLEKYLKEDPSMQKQDKNFQFYREAHSPSDTFPTSTQENHLSIGFGERERERVSNRENEKSERERERE